MNTGIEQFLPRDSKYTSDILKIKSCKLNISINSKYHQEVAIMLISNKENLVMYFC